MRYLIIFITIAFSSCSFLKESAQDRKCNHFIKHESRLLAKIKMQCKNCIDSSNQVVKMDSTIKADSLSGETDIKSDTNSLDSVIVAYTDTLKTLLQENGKHKDTNQILKALIRQIEKKLEGKIFYKFLLAKIDPVSGDTLNLSFKIWQDGNKLKYLFVKKEQDIHLKKNIQTLTIECPPTPFYKNEWFWAFVLASILLILSLIRK